ncbi:MAG: DMT family transporter [Clostridia bacterium]|nr:DMT family transporter [Clostridia bacterium]
MAWVYLVTLYSVIKGIREILKKKSLQISSLAEVLFFHTLIGLILVIPTCTTDVFNITISQFFVMLIKSSVIFLAWILSFTSIKHTPISFCGIIDMSRIVFSTLLAIIVLGEKMTVFNTIGFLLVILGVFLVNFKKASKTESIKPVFIVLMLLSCFLNAVSGLIDKIVMKDMTSAQVQFWYMLFLSIMYFVFLLVKQGKNINYKALAKNHYVWILSVIFVIADRALFIANSYPESKVTIMTLIKQSSVFIVVLLGKFVFKEKNIAYKMLCASIIILGVLISLF